MSHQKSGDLNRQFCSPATVILISIFLISASALAYEILLMRLFSIIQWHHFASMVISLALLGFGVSGTMITLLGERLVHHFRLVYIINACLFSIASVGCFLLAQQISFNPLEALWDVRQWWKLTEVFLLLLLPFLFAANCICLSFLRYKEYVSRLYAADLCGAGIGALGVIVLLNFFFPLTVLNIVSLFGLTAAIILVHRPIVHVVVLSLGVGISLFLGVSDTALRSVEYKQLSQTLNQSNSRVIAERSSSLGLITVVESSDIPFRYAPGLSPLSAALPPDQLGLFVDGDGMTAINRFNGELKTLNFLSEMLSAAPYQLLDKPDVLILGSGGGSSLLQALRHEAKHIDAVELNADVIELIRDEFASYSGSIYQHEKVTTHIAEARRYLESSSSQYDLIQMELMDAFNTSSAGLSALNESYLYTVEAIQKTLNHLNPNGLLAIGRWIRLPPREGPKLLATVIEAMERSGFHDPDNSVIWIRSWNLAVLLVKNGTFKTDEINLIRHFSQKRSFDLVWVPGIQDEEVNRYNRLAEPYFYRAAKALFSGDSESYINNNKFNIAAVTDNKPYFFRFFRWRILSDVFENLKTGGYNLLDLGYLVLIASLLIATVFSFVLIVLPILIGKRTKSDQKIFRGNIVLYFACLGFGFMFIEIALMQRFSLYLSHPIISAATILSSFLVFAGLGSLFVGWTQRKGFSRRLIVPVSAIVLFTLLYFLFLQSFFSFSIGLSDIARIIISVLLIAPLAFFMGMPFPVGLTHLSLLHGEEGLGLIAWAWCINGCASVIGAVLATLLASHFGISSVLLTGSVIYCIAVFSFQYFAKAKYNRSWNY